MNSGGQKESQVQSCFTGGASVPSHATSRIRLNFPSVAVMRSYVKLLRPLVSFILCSFVDVDCFQKRHCRHCRLCVQQRMMQSTDLCGWLGVL